MRTRLHHTHEECFCDLSTDNYLHALVSKREVGTSQRETDQDCKTNNIEPNRCNGVTMCTDLVTRQYSDDRN
jgi:hypothetical protein